MRYTIKAPTPVTAKVINVHFREGVAEVDSENRDQRRALAYFRRHGYVVEPVEDQAPDEEPEHAEEQEAESSTDPGAQTTTGRPPRSATKAEWAAYARGIAVDADEVDAIDDMTKEQLVARYGAEQQGEQA